MKLTQNYNFIWLIFILELVAAEVSTDEKKTTTDISNENVLNFMLNKLNNINEKDDMMNQKLTNLAPNMGNWFASLINDYQTQIKMEIISQAINDMRRSQLEQNFYFEKQFAEIKQILNQNCGKAAAENTLNDENKSQQNKFESQIQQGLKQMDENYQNLTSQLNLVQLEMMQSLVETKMTLNSLENSIQSITLKVEKLESSVPNIEKNLETYRCNLTKQDLYTEFQILRNTMDNFNRKLVVVENHFVPSYSSCAAALETTGQNGVYYLNISYPGLAPFEAYCLADLNEGSAWTVIQRRQDGSVAFNRTWYEYKHGFGDPNGEYWLGLEKIHAMTWMEKYELRIELEDHEGERRHANYAHFEIGNEAENYYLKALWNYTGDAGDDLDYAMKYGLNFTTIDRENDAFRMGNCAADYNSAWWYFACGNGGLNGEYDNYNANGGVNWIKWHGPSYSFKYAHMAIRPVK